VSPAFQSTEFQSVLHWIYLAVMALGAITFMMMSRNPRGVPVYEYVIAIFIPIWSGLAYMAMALEQGKLEVAGQLTHYARYIDWVVTTPLLLLALALTAMNKGPKHVSLIATLMGTQVIVIVTGLVADLSANETLRYVWYSVSVAAFFVVLYLIWNPLQRIASGNSAELGGVYRRVVTYFTVFWVCYPIVWIIGPSGFGLISQDMDTLLYVVLPIFSKVGFSLYDLTLLRGLSDEHASKTRLAGSH
jgi:bacteriorhodopsin